MPALHNRERDTSDHRDQVSRPNDDDREISLGTGTILAIFFALALVCAVFFGLGYTMGRKSAQPGTVAGTTTDPSPSNSIFSGFKPAAGSPGNQPSSVSKKEPVAPSKPSADPDAEIVTDPTPSSDDPPATARATQPARREAAQSASPQPATFHEPSRANQTLSQSSAMPVTNPNGTSIVQVAAVSHQEDADVLISALKKRGYAVFIRQEPQDHLLHVQVGPFATKRDAEVMRQRLLSDGYNAIVK